MKSLYNTYLNLFTIPPFLEKYLNVPSLVRLKNISYLCGMEYASKDIYDFKENISRYDHSLTVALLTWKFTNDKLSTLTGLFHDIATPCFSHTIDYMNKDYETQESTEEYTEEIIKNDKILLEQLKKDNIPYKALTNFKKYTIVDNERPKLCADRFDGIILTGIAWTKTLSCNDIIEITSDLTVYDNEHGEKELGFKTLIPALKAIETSEKIDLYCHSDEDNYMMELLAKITKHAIAKKIVCYKELFYIDENTLFTRMKNSKDEYLLKLLYEFENIKKEDIKIFSLSNVKKRELNPLINGKRYKDYMTILK